MAVLIVATLRRVAPAQTLPRGERGPRLATDLQPRPVPQSYPAGSGIGSSGIPCSAYTRKYPIPGTRRGPYTVGQQCVRNTVENIVRIKPVNIVNRYNWGRTRCCLRWCTLLRGKGRPNTADFLLRTTGLLRCDQDSKKRTCKKQTFHDTPLWYYRVLSKTFAAGD